MKCLLRAALLFAASLLPACLALFSPAVARAGHADRDDLLLGFHFNFDRRGPVTTTSQATLDFGEFARFLPDQLERVSYADWWVTWNMAERYKGDELGLERIDRQVNEALEHGVKVKLVLIFSSWWTNDIDWATTTTLGGAPNADEYASWCGRFAEHLRGRVATLDLQGEANSGDYWRPVPNLSDPMRHIADVYLAGARAIRKADPHALIGIADVTPGLGGINQLGQPISKENIIEWYEYHLAACAGTYDIAMINYFADIDWADPFGDGWNYYKTVREILDRNGQHAVELGSGESSVEWAEDSWTLDTLSERQQAWRLNQTLGLTYTDGMTKWMWHGLPQPPGQGWVWRWGWSKYQDHWGIWPESAKIPGTQIVFSADHATSGPVDYRPAFSRPASPRIPATEVFDFWTQAFPNSSSALRLPIAVEATGRKGRQPGEVYRLGSYLRTRDEAVALVYTTQTQSLALTLDVARTGWAEGTQLIAEWRNETIDLANGDRRINEDAQQAVLVEQGKVALTIEPGNDWTTLRLRPLEHGARLEQAAWPARGETGAALTGALTLRNTGATAWPGDGTLELRRYDDRAGAAPGEVVGTLREAVKRCGTGSISFTLTAAEQPQRERYRLRLYRNGWFGPVFELFTDLDDSTQPRDFLALRERGHVRLNWFAPQRMQAAAYEILRAEGIDGEEQPITTTDATEYIDTDVKPDTEYYYRVRAIDDAGERGGFSQRDNARAISTPRHWDAEIVTHSIPATLRPGQSGEATITVRNTGRHAWDKGRASFWLQTTQLWGERNEAALPRFSIALERPVEPGGEVTVTLPYVAPRAGEFVNHWVMRMDAGKGSVFFGSPLRAMTTATP